MKRHSNLSNSTLLWIWVIIHRYMLIGSEHWLLLNSNTMQKICFFFFFFNVFLSLFKSELETALKCKNKDYYVKKTEPRQIQRQYIISITVSLNSQKEQSSVQPASHWTDRYESEFVFEISGDLNHWSAKVINHLHLPALQNCCSW